MHESTHVRIAKALSKKMCFTSEQEKIFIMAIVEPDKWRRKNPRSKHHYLKRETIINLVMMARTSLLRGEVSSCLRQLGVALHFVQDACLPSPRTKHRRKVHASLEGKIKSLPIPEEDINAGFRFSWSSPRFIENVVSNIRWAYDAETALSQATRAFAEIVAAVFGSKDPPNGLPENYRIMKKSHNKRILKASAISMLSLIAGSFLSLVTGKGFLLLLSLFSPFLVFSTLVWNDRKFYEIEREAKWYGIE